MICISACLAVLGSLLDLMVLPALYEPVENLVTCFFLFGFLVWVFVDITFYIIIYIPSFLYR